MATRLRRLWALFILLAAAAAVLLAARGADGEEGRHRHGHSGARVSVDAPGDWVLIKAGSFMMGSPLDEPGRGTDEVQHHVTITRDFILQSTEVTQAQWQQVMGNNPSFFENCGRDCPVEKVTWFEAVAYTNALSKRAGLPECYRLDGCTQSPGHGMLCTSVSFEGLSCSGYRLPTEAEWEYAARAGTTRPRYGDLHSIAWFFTNSGLSTHPVGQKMPNLWGLYDIFGNTREWCHDWYGPFPPGPARDPIGPSEGILRVRRGGAWFYLTSYTRAADRMGCAPDYRRSGIGIRPARTFP